MYSKGSLEEYKAAIERLAKNKSELVFNNTGIEHAAIVLSNIFINSNDVKIYANDMNGEISSQLCYTKSINDFVSRNGKLQIILDNASNLSNSLKGIIGKDNVEIRLSDEEFRKNLTEISKNNKLNYFAVGDRNMVRVELDNVSHKALCSFNLPDTGGMLSDFFDKRYKSLEKPSFN